MALIRSVRGFTPIIGKDTFLADNATIVGDVVIGDGCSIWFGTILRGDVNSIRIGNGVNIQDGSVLHTLYEKSTIEIGDDVSIGHNVTIHGAKICHGALIGMGSVVMDHAVIGEGAIVHDKSISTILHILEMEGEALAIIRAIYAYWSYSNLATRLGQNDRLLVAGHIADIVECNGHSGK